MEMKLAENIRRFRKERSLTQEQLAEVLGVTVGAVYKWEAGLSVPELAMIVELADFYDTSVDVLLGYGMKDNSLSATVQRLHGCLDRKDCAGLAEAEKALKKYPNDFGVVHTAARLYNAFGMESGEKHMLRRALELTERAIVLLPQNTDPSVGEATLYGESAAVHMMLDEDETAVRLMRGHNTGGLYNDLIGVILSDKAGREDEAVPYLADALLDHAVALIRTVTGYMNVYFAKKDFASGRDILRWGVEIMKGLRQPGRPSFPDKMAAVFMVYMACAQLNLGEGEEALACLDEALELAQRFDEAPDYGVGSIRFAGTAKSASVYDDLGTTARQSLENAVEDTGSAELSALWRELSAQ